MKVFRTGVFALALLAVSFAFSTPSRAEIRWIDPVQALDRPPAFTLLGEHVAIDGGHIIVIGGYEGVRQALLYRRDSRGWWVLRRSLVTWTGPYMRASVTMRNGIAAVQFDDQITLFELAGGDYVQQTSTAPIRHHGGVAISGRSVLIGGNNCDYDAVIYQKNSSGSWAITGRLDDNQGECLDSSYNYAVELHYDYALLRPPYGLEGVAWRRNGTAVEWVRAGSLPFLPNEGVPADGRYALQRATAVAPLGVIWRRSGTSTWTRQSVLKTVDYDNRRGPAWDPVYRDGVLVASYSAWYGVGTAVHVETSPGQFEHVGALRSYREVVAYDVSGRTVVTANQDIQGGANREVQVFNLPTQLRVPPQLVNDFEDRNVSDFTFSGGQFAVATRGTDDVLAQSASSGLAVAVMNDSDWTDQQRVEADITPRYGTGGWVGLVARYVDADNYYSLRIRDNQTFGIYKRVNGVITVLATCNFTAVPNRYFEVRFLVINDQLHLYVDNVLVANAHDRDLTSGRYGIATYRAAANWDTFQVLQP